ncbi:MAG: hypothetical protein H6553_09485 [Chitinophagales bacterium]|nr:hypothetical protein [Chitinophagales bacterium]
MDIINFLVSKLPKRTQFKIRHRRYKNNYNQWINNSNNSLPVPHYVKQLTINKIKQEFNFDVFIETGTYLGDMIYAQKDNFKKIYSIELSDMFYKNATNFFKDYKHVKLYQGDSGEEMEKIVNELDEPAIFWLDGHYSGGNTAKGDLNCPIIKELSAIYKSRFKNHIILIDDARLFVGENDYPSLDEIKESILMYNDNYSISVENDIIICKST